MATSVDGVDIPEFRRAVEAAERQGSPFGRRAAMVHMVAGDARAILGALERAERIEIAAACAVEMHDTCDPDDPVVHRAMWALGEALERRADA